MKSYTVTKYEGEKLGPIDCNRNPNARAVEVEPAWHPVYYRATQVGGSAPCFKRPALEVGMRVLILDDRNEFTGRPSKPTFYAARVKQIGTGVNPLVTFEYEAHPYATSMAAEMDYIAKFCIVQKEADMVGKVNIKRVGGYDPKKPHKQVTKRKPKATK